MTTNFSPIAYYHEQCMLGSIQKDPQQLLVLDYLEKLHSQLIEEKTKRNQLFAFMRKPKLIKGFYLWGNVGIGKTFLMDCFFHTLPFAEKKRMHFHLFMQFIHQQLKLFQGKTEPLQIIAKQLAKQTILLCFDELVVNDITDAMLLGRLFKFLFAEGVCLVATSNVKPDDLYKNGLQRKLFLPAIALLKEHTTVYHLPSTHDYRLHSLKNVNAFYTPNNDFAEESMAKIFNFLTEEQEVNEHPIVINNRSILVKKSSAKVVWFEFENIVGIPRSQLDYLEIAKQYHTVFISNVPQISAKNKNTITLFIRLIDVLYDANIRLVLSAVSPLEKIYENGPMLFEFKRTLSRLLEMQSERYFAKER